MDISGTMSGLLSRTALLVLVSIEMAVCFNLELETRRLFTGPRDSYYGFSLALMTDKKIVLIGAPRDNDTFLPDIYEPGAIHRCQLPPDFGGAADCTQLHIDSTTGSDSVDFNGKSRYFKHGKDGQWLGVSIEAIPGKTGAGIITCAHRWYNTGFLDQGEYFMNGICYEIPTDFNTANIVTIPALVDGNKQTTVSPLPGKPFMYDYGMGNLGMAIHYTRRGEDLLMTAPGMKDWTGGFVDYRGRDVYIMNSDTNRAATTRDRLLGYAVSSGRYFSDGVTYFAFGEPRYELTGRVVLFRSDNTRYLLDDRNAVVDDTVIRGLPINAYFGGSICSEDVNGDGFDDLLVGAPLFSQASQYSLDSVSVHGEEGRVFLLLGTNNGKLEFTVTAEPLVGSAAFMARFGSAITSLGDLNIDTYNDIAVGAPYEEGGGVVYIYNGFAGGLWPRHSQRITGQALDPGLRGFGHAFSRAGDITDDGFNDVAVGAYASGQAVLLHGQPVLDMSVTLITVEEIEQDMKTFDLQLCFLYDYKDCQNMYMNVTKTLDVGKGEYPRLTFDNGLSKLHTTDRIWLSAKTCTRDPVTVKSTNDLVTPVLIMVRYEVASMDCPDTDIKPTINRFNGRAPSDPILLKQKEINFKKDCPDNLCLTDLSLQATLSFDGVDGAFIIGTSALSIDVAITKTGHPSYGSTLLVTFPLSLGYKKVETLSGDFQVSCDFLEDLTVEDLGGTRTSVASVKEEPQENTLACFFGNPMSNDTGVDFSILLQAPEKLTDNQLSFVLNATTQSKETNPADNVQSLQIDVKYQVSSAMSGISTPDFLSIKDTRDYHETTHVYEARNLGPSPMPAARFNVYYPQVQGESQAQLFLNSTETRCKSPCEMKCDVRTVGASPPVFSWFEGQVTRHDSMDKNSDSFSEFTILDCAKESCSVFSCSVANLPPRDSAVISLHMLLHRTFLDIVTEGQTTIVVSKAVFILDKTGVITDTDTQSASVSTGVVSPSVPTKPVDWWIPVLSAILGLVLVAVLVIILWKVGFFKRKKRDELEKRRLVQDGAASKTPTEAPCEKEVEADNDDDDDDSGDKCDEKMNGKHSDDPDEVTI